MLRVAAVLLLASVKGFVVPVTTTQRTKLNFLSPEMSGWIEKTMRGEQYDQVVTETMRREDCTRAEAEAKYNNYLCVAFRLP